MLIVNLKVIEIKIETNELIAQYLDLVLFKFFPKCFLFYTDYKSKMLSSKVELLFTKKNKTPTFRLEIFDYKPPKNKVKNNF